MKYKYLLIVALFITSVNLYGQDIRVGNNFVILINNKLTTSVAGLRLVLTDSAKKKETINGGYIPGEIYVSRIEEKNVLFADSIRNLTLAFDNYEYKGQRQFVHNYSIGIDRKWFKTSVIILHIFDTSKGKYKYTFEVPGYSFAIKK